MENQDRRFALKAALLSILAPWFSPVSLFAQRREPDRDDRQRRRGAVPSSIPVAPPANPPSRAPGSTCASCIYFDGVQFCQRYPPVMTQTGNQVSNVYFMFAQTLASTWCGEWQNAHPTSTSSRRRREGDEK